MSSGVRLFVGQANLPGSGFLVPWLCQAQHHARAIARLIEAIMRLSPDKYEELPDGRWQLRAAANAAPLVH